MIRWFSTECRVRKDVMAIWNNVRVSRCCSMNSSGVLVCNSTCMNTIPPDILDAGHARLLYWTDGDGIADTGPAWHEHGSLPITCDGSVSLTYNFGSQTKTYTVTPDWHNPESYYGCPQEANRTHLLRQPLTLRETRMGDAAGFTDPAYYSTLRFPDLNGDGKADACARASTGIICELSDGSSFGTLSRWSI